MLFAIMNTQRRRFAVRLLGGTVFVLGHWQSLHGEDDSTPVWYRPSRWWRQVSLCHCTMQRDDCNEHECSGGSSGSVPKFTMEMVEAELPTMQQAQRMTVRRYPAAVSDAEIQHVIRWEEQHRDQLGSTRRDGEGIKRADSPWRTSYMHSAGMFQKDAGNQALLDKLVDLAVAADAEEGWGLLCKPGTDGTGAVHCDRNQIRIRVVELHTVGPHGSLPDPKHCDLGSLVTIDVMLADPVAGDFQGGRFCTLESDGKLLERVFERGDVTVFPSHKYHCIAPVKSGQRRVMVIELWRGEARTCAHRCLQHFGPCTYSAAQSRVDLILTSALPEVDPW